MRLALVNTPRSGSTWLRQLLQDAYAVPGLAAVNPDAVDWAGLPGECVLALHWRRTPALARRLHEGQFHTATVVRHPLDVLLSVLQFCLHDDSTSGWLDGEAGDEGPIRGAMPGSARPFWTTQPARAAALLAVSRDWAADPDCLCVRYEDLVADPPGQLRRVAEALGEPARRPAAEVAAAATLPAMRPAPASITISGRAAPACGRTCSSPPTPAGSLRHTELALRRWATSATRTPS